MPRPLPISTSFAEGVSLIMLRIDSFNLFGLNKVRVTLLHVPTFLFLCLFSIWYLSVVCMYVFTSFPYMYVCMYLPHSHIEKRSLLQRLLPFWQTASPP